MDRTAPSLSAIIPIYNAESTLQSCLESILNQSYGDFELILVDDGSTDNSPKLCDAYMQMDSRVAVIHIKNSGAFQARKRGAEKATGKILTFSDADDWLEENAFETAMQLFRKYDPDILAYTYDRDEGKVEKHLHEEGLYRGEEIRNEIVPGMMYDSASGGAKLNPSLCCKLIKKKLFTRVTESVKDRITLGDDALVTYPAICLAESIFICNKALYHYNTATDSSCTHIYPLERITEVKAFQNNIVRLFRELGMLDQMSCQVESYIRLFCKMMIKNWYGIEISPITYLFPYNSVLKGSRVFIYGAGSVGKSYINELKLTNYASIAGWADKNYEKIKIYNYVDVIAPELIKEKSFDVLLIAVRDAKIAYDIKTDLVNNMGICDSKIIWEKPIHVI